MSVTQRRHASDRVRAWLDARLPQSEFSVSLLDRARLVLEVEDGGELVGCAVAVDGVDTLSGAPVLVAVYAEGMYARRMLEAPLVTLASGAGSIELLGPGDVAQRLAEEVARQIGGVVTSVMEQRLMLCREAQIPWHVPGWMRRARPQDTVLLARWLDAFAVEALGAEPRGGVPWEEQIADASGDVYVWEVGGQLVAMVMARRTTRYSHRVAPVYTPPAHRKHGYASALTAHVTRSLLERGDLRVVLLTDVNNPTSNAIYQAVGYETVDRHSSWAVRTLS